ncbi:MAG TPA: LysM domain-containing protein, partial [Acidobacteriota bacterium]|nr:LysM domain-containing protein [Acidobacteriota bacterium]
ERSMGNGNPRISGSGSVHSQNTAPSDDQTTTVRAGESNLSDVARRLNVSVESLKQANPQLGQANSLKPGMEIKLPKPNQPKQASAQGTTQAQGNASGGAGARTKVGDHQLEGQLKNAELRKLEAAALQDGVITEDEAKAMKGGDKGYLKYMLEHDSLHPKARKVIEDAIHDKVAIPKDSVVGQKIAVVGADKKPAIVAREFGSQKGFATKMEALALARGANSDAAAIFYDGKRWHAVETNVPLKQGNTSFSAESRAGNLQFVPKPDIKEWQDARKEVDRLKSQGLTLNDTALQEAYRNQIAVALGVPATEVNIVRKPEDIKPDGINFNPYLPSLGNAGPAKLDGKPHPLQIGLGQLAMDNPFEVITTAFHEATHVRHHARGNELLQQWGDIKGKKPAFDDWLKDQYRNNKITLEEKATVLSEFRGGAGATESIAYVNGFMATFAVDRADERMIASELGMAASKSPGDPDLEKDLMQRLESFYGSLDDTDRTRFNAAMDKAKKDHPDSWLAKFQHS